MSDTLLVSTRKGLFTVARKGSEWQIAGVDFLGDNVTLTLKDRRDGLRYAALDHGHFGVKLQSLDGQRLGGDRGAGLSAQAGGATRSTTCGAGPSTGARPASGRSRPVGLTSPASSGAARCRAGSSARSIMGRAGTWSARSGIIPSASSGWAAAPTCPASIRSASIRATPSACGLGVSTGGIWVTEDGGASWSLRGEGMRAEYAPPEQTHDPIAQDVHCLVQCRAAPQRMWVQHHNGIFVSSDESKTFKEITGVEPSTFGFPVVVHPREPDTAWFVPEIRTRNASRARQARCDAHA